MLNELYMRDSVLNACVHNMQRLRYWSVFLIILTGLQLSSPFLFPSFWSHIQLSAFRIFDIFLGTVTILVFYVSHFQRPRQPGDVKAFHRFVIIFYVFSHLVWTAFIAGIESVSGNGMPTFLIGIFTAATLFILSTPVFLAALTTGLATLFLTVTFLHIPLETIEDQYYTVIILVVAATITSRVLHITHRKNYVSNRELETVNNTLDTIVKERTKELSTTNLLLKNEIEIRIRFEKELKKALMRAEEADRLKTLFLANMSHEVRTPLNGILGFSDLLKHQASGRSEKCDQFIDIIHQSGEQLLKIIDDILDISMIESNQLKIRSITFQLNDLLRNTLEFFSSYKMAQDRGVLTISYTCGRPDGEDVLYTDPGRLQQILNNLIKNAIKFTAAGSIHYGYSIHEPEILFFVEDTGTGIPAELQDKIFDRFIQGENADNRKQGGTGLGLAISKGIAECLRGRIWLDTSYSPGARFCLSLPYITEKPASVKEEEIGSKNFSDALKGLGLR